MNTTIAELLMYVRDRQDLQDHLNDFIPNRDDYLIYQRETRKGIAELTDLIDIKLWELTQ